MSNENKEKVGAKAYTQIRKEGFEAGQRAIEETARKLVERGFDERQVKRAVSTGVSDAATTVYRENV